MPERICVIFGHLQQRSFVLYLRSHTRDLCQIFGALSHGRGSVFLRQYDEILRGRGSVEVFLSSDNALQRVRCKRDHSIANNVRQQK